jgi:hypothetical protein
MSWYDRVLSIYKSIKHFPKDSTLKIKPNSNGDGVLIHNNYWYLLILNMVLFLGLFIMLIAAVINYEIIFRDKELERTKTDLANKKNIDEIARDRYYSKPENKTGLAVFVPLLVIMVFVFGGGCIYYYKYKSGK